MKENVDLLFIIAHKKWIIMLTHECTKIHFSMILCATLHPSVSPREYIMSMWKIDISKFMHEILCDALISSHHRIYWIFSCLFKLLTQNEWKKIVNQGKIECVMTSKCWVESQLKNEEKSIISGVIIRIYEVVVNLRHNLVGNVVVVVDDAREVQLYVICCHYHH